MITMKLSLLPVLKSLRSSLTMMFDGWSSLAKTPMYSTSSSRSSALPVSKVAGSPSRGSFLNKSFATGATAQAGSSSRPSSSMRLLAREAGSLRSRRAVL